MKAKPVRLIHGVGYEQCSVEEATHVTLNIPGPTGKLTLPVIQRGKREGTGCWTWNGSTEAPTLRPSVLTEGHSATSNGPFRCHSWINDGAAQFLSDCSHELTNQTVPLLDVQPDMRPDPACPCCHGHGRYVSGYSGREDDGNAALWEDCDCFIPAGVKTPDGEQR